MKNIIKIIVFIFFTSCTYTQLIDVVGNKILTNKDDFYEFYKKIRTEDLLYDPSLKWSVNRLEKNGMKYVKYDNLKKSENLLLYVHGGAFERKYIQKLQLYLVKNVNYYTKSNYEIIFLDYKGNNDQKQKEELGDFLDYVTKKYKKIVLMSDSSGGNVVLANILRRRDENKKLVDGIVLLSPWTDVSNRVKSRITNFNKDVLMGVSTYQTSLLYNKYVSKDIFNPYVSPIYGEFHNFPKTLIQYGEFEVLKDDSVIVCNKMNKVNVDCKLEEYKGMTHGFQFYKTKQTNKAIKNIALFIDDVIINK